MLAIVVLLQSSVYKPGLVIAEKMQDLELKDCLSCPNVFVTLNKLLSQDLFPLYRIKV